MYEGNWTDGINLAKETYTRPYQPSPGDYHLVGNSRQTFIGWTGNMKQVFRSNNLLGKAQIPQGTCMILPIYSSCSNVLVSKIPLIQVAGVLLNSGYRVGAWDIIWLDRNAGWTLSVNFFLSLLGWELVLEVWLGSGDHLNCESCGTLRLLVATLFCCIWSVFHA
jgi:hypothetical protein